MGACWITGVIEDKHFRDIWFYEATEVVEVWLPVV